MRTAEQDPPRQLDRETLSRMTPDQVIRAQQEGLCADLLSGRRPRAEYRRERCPELHDLDRKATAKLNAGAGYYVAVVRRASDGRYRRVGGGRTAFQLLAPLSPFNCASTAAARGRPPRTRERRDATGRGSTRAGPDDDSGESEPPGDAGRHICAEPNCTASISRAEGRRGRPPRYCEAHATPAARKARSRRPDAGAPELDLENVPVAAVLYAIGDEDRGCHQQRGTPCRCIRPMRLEGHCLSCGHRARLAGDQSYRGPAWDRGRAQGTLGRAGRAGALTWGSVNKSQRPDVVGQTLAKMDKELSPRQRWQGIARLTPSEQLVMQERPAVGDEAEAWLAARWRVETEEAELVGAAI